MEKGVVKLVLFNDEDFDYWKNWNSLSPLLFNVVVDVFTRMLARDAEVGWVVGLLDQFREGGILALQYADDMMFFSTYDKACLRNLRGVLLLFEAVSGMRINFYKSEIIPMNIEGGEARDIAHMLTCPAGSLLVKYLGVPLHFEKLKKEDQKPILDKYIKRIAG
jgi:hypothetical protein